jgi:hypothetical protein
MKSLAAAFFTAVNLLYASLFGGPIDGTAWDVKVKEEGFFHWRSSRETLVFHGGHATIAGEVAKGYSPALYDTDEENGSTVFKVQLADSGRDLVEWTGHVDGEKIAGVVLVRSRDGHSRRFVFSGNKRKIG